MKRLVSTVFAGASLIAVASAARAQTAPAEVPAAEEAREEARAGTEDIIVNARRRDELLQDIPVTVNAVSGSQIEKLNIQKFEDVQAVVPGLTLSGGSNGYTTAATIRGASFQVESSATPTVEFYLNDALIQSTYLFQSMFDVGQIEVLRGPQGTLRGRASPSGSITVTSRRADLYSMGGYVTMTGSDQGGINGNAAIGLPIVEGVLGVRVAGIVDHNESDQVRSINDMQHPRSETEGIRASVRFEPTSSISANVMYQHIERRLRTFTPVESISIVDPSQSSGTSRIIRGSDRRAIQDEPAIANQKQDILTGQIDWSFAGQRLSYVGSWSKQDVKALSSQDYANIVRTRDVYQDLHTISDQKTHELRLASEERLFEALDYTVGAFYSKFASPSDLVNPSIVTLFGNPVSFVSTPIKRGGDGQKEVSFFGNLTTHIGEDTELSGGARYIIFESDSTLTVSGAQLAHVYEKHDPVVYNASLSHKFSDDFMVYGNTGSSWRAGPTIIGVFRPLTPRLSKYINLRPETSKSYEIGFKSSFWDKRVRFNVAAFHQSFKNFIYRGNLVNFVDLNAQGARPNTFNFGANVDTKIKGIEADIAFQPSRHFNIGANFSYANGKIQDDFIACNDLNRDGIPDANPGTPTAAQIATSAGGEAIAECRVNDRTAFAPDWTLTLQSEYSAPISSHIDSYVRGLLTYYDKNPGDPTNPYDNVDSYGLLNVYAGIRAPDGAWEVSFFAKNLTDTGVVLNRGNALQGTVVQALQPPTFQAAVGQTITAPYLSARYTAPREFGLNVRFAFGSR